MDWKKLALGGVFVGGALVGCSNPGGGTDTFDTPRTHNYVVSVVRIPEAAGTMAYGFNLDGENSTGEGTTCVELTPDYDSINDPGESGVDNGLAALVPTLSMLVGDLDMTIAEQIASGSLLLVMQVGGIDSYTNDSAVTLQLFRGEVMGGGMPMLEGDGTLSPGQDFTLTSVAPPVNGSISNGRLRAQTDSLDLMIDAGGDIGIITLTLHDAQVRGNISQTGLANGAIGGAIVIEELAATAEMIMEGYGDLVRSAVQGDLQPDPADDTMCLSISAGISFTGIDAVDEFDDATD